jgi:hypothetical protein
MQQRLDQEILFLEYSDESQYSFLCGSFVVNVVLMFSPIGKLQHRNSQNPCQEDSGFHVFTVKLSQFLHRLYIRQFHNPDTDDMLL